MPAVFLIFAFSAPDLAFAEDDATSTAPAEVLSPPTMPVTPAWDRLNPPSEAVEVQAPETETAVSDSPQAGENSNIVQASVDVDEDSYEALPLFSANYFSIMYGPSLQNASDYQPNSDGTPDYTRPLLMKNFIGGRFGITDTIGITPTAYWTMTPIRGQQIQMQDPFIKVSDNTLISLEDGLNVYGDIRYHFPLSPTSQENDQKGSIQTVQVITYQPGFDSRVTLGLYGSERAYFFGPHSVGNDLEFYIGPNASYQLSSNVALTLLFEENLVHDYGQKPFQFRNGGTDIEPGVEWDITHTISINPYLNFYPQSVNWNATSVGMILNWRMI